MNIINAITQTLKKEAAKIGFRTLATLLRSFADAIEKSVDEAEKVEKQIS
jgi:hypothetical protein